MDKMVMHVTWMGEINSQEGWSEGHGGGDHLGDISRDGKTALKWILKKWDLRAWTGCN